MKVVVASDSYKSCMRSSEVAQIIAKAIHRLDETIEIATFSVGDGGEGTLEAFVEAGQGTYVHVRCKDAYGKEIETYYGIIDEGKTAVIEVSNIIGLQKYPKEKRNAFYASSYGVGQVLVAVKQKGCQKIILALGGSATNDGGMGMLCALGARFYDQDHRPLKAIAANLSRVDFIDFRDLEDFSQIECIAACDVKNKLLGEEGATHVFGKQKGLYPNQIRKVEKGMQHYAQQMKKAGYPLDEVVGGGAAGGIGAVFVEVCHASMKPGISLLFSYNHIEKAIQDCDLVITGEGQSDKQTMFGKVPAGVIEVANQYHKPCICISGALGLEYTRLYDLGFIGVYSIADRAMSFTQAIEQAPEKLAAATYNIMKTILYYQKESV